MRVGTVAVLMAVAASVAPAAAAQPSLAVSGTVHERRSFPLGGYGVAKPTALTYLPAARALVAGQRDGALVDLVGVTPGEDLIGTMQVEAPPGGLALTFDPAERALVGVTGAARVAIDEKDLWRTDARATRQDHPTLGLGDAAGAVASRDGTLWVLDAADRELIITGPAGTRRVPLGHLGTDLRGLGRGPDELLYLTADAATLYGVDATLGTPRAAYDLRELGARAFHGVAFGPSADPTDAPGTISAYLLADRGAPGGFDLVEATLPDPSEVLNPEPDTAQAVPNDVASLIKTVALSKLSPPSPDSAGVAYMPGTDRLIVSDSEVNEMSIYAGANLFTLTRAGALTATGNTLAFSEEPTGLGFDPNGNRLLVSDDDADQVTILTWGADKKFGTSDDGRTPISTKSFSSDCEDVAYDTATKHIFTVDGVAREVYRINPGPNGTFGNSDDSVSSFDIGTYGADDPEGIAYDARFETLLVVDQGSQKVYELNRSGTLLRTIDISAARSVKAAGIEVAPSSADPSKMSLWIVDRGEDNDGNSKENDGMLYEMTMGGPPPPVNKVPATVISSPADGATFPDAGPITFTGDATDPEDGNVGASLKWVSDRDGQIGTGKSFTTTLSVGRHVVTATATDSKGATGAASISIVSGNPPLVASFAAAANSDDAEEETASGAVDLGSSDLELGLDRSTPQIVGVRFNAAIPPSAYITRAFVQFRVDESSTNTSSLTIDGQAIDNAPTFTTANKNISGRARTTASVTWNPPTWPSTGAAGADQRTPDLSAIVKEIVGRAGWRSGNGLALFFRGTGSRVADSVDGGGAPVLVVEYLTSPPKGPPSVEITAPNDASTHGLDAITFTGTATDSPDGDLSSAIAWTSSKDGALGTGASISKKLTAGAHTITATVTDSDGEKATDTITVTVQNKPATVSIDSPADGSSASVAATVTFTGSAYDDGTGDISSSIAWESSLDGALGTGASVSKKLRVGTHTITARVTDPPSGTASDQITITIKDLPPSVSITKPSDGASFFVSDAIAFAGTATDPEDGDRSSTLTWMSSIDGSIGTGGSFTKSLTPGTHQIDAVATDTTGATGSATVTITVVNRAPTVDITAPADGASFASGAPVSFSGTASDPESGSLSTSIAWSSSKDGAFGTGASVQKVLSDGTHTIVASVTDGHGTSGSDSITIIVGAPPEPTRIQVPVAANSDDAEEAVSNRAVDLGSSDLELIDDKGAQVVGMRFRPAIPKGARIQEASIQFIVDEATSGAANLVVHGQAAGNAATFAGTAGNISGRARTTASVSWSPPDWPTVGAAGAAQRTPNLAAIIQEIVDRSDWASANGLVLMVSGSGKRTADSTDGGGAPVLHVAYHDIPATGPPAVTITSPDDGSGASKGQSITFAATAVDPAQGDVSSRLTWSSNLIGTIGSGATFSRTLPEGIHTITASATDVDGETGTDQIIVTIADQPPVVEITAPSDGAYISSGAKVTLTGTATDNEDGSLSSSISWSSDVQGALGTGASIEVVLTDGDHRITATATDSGAQTGSDAIDVTVGTPRIPVLREIPLIGDINDAEEWVTDGSVDLGSSDLELGLEGSQPQRVGMRWQLPIPRGATISSASVQFRVDETSTGTSSLTIRGQATDDAPAFTTARNDIGARGLTSASVSWSPPDWTSTGVAGPAQRTPDIAAVLQEIVGRPGWLAGNHLALIITGIGRRTADSHEGGGAPVLRVEYLA